MTVVAPAPRGRTGTPSFQEPPPEAPPPRKRRSGLAMLAVVLVLALAAGGSYFAGLWPSSLPTADPFTLTVSRTPSDGLTAEGFVPSAAFSEQLTEHLAAFGGTASLTVARGPVGKDWEAGVMSLLDFLSPLEELSVSIVNDQARVTGMTENRRLHDQLSANLAEPGIVPGLTVEAALELGRAYLPCHRCASSWTKPPIAENWPCPMRPPWAMASGIPCVSRAASRCPRPGSPCARASPPWRGRERW